MRLFGLAHIIKWLVVIIIVLIHIALGKIEPNEPNVLYFLFLPVLFEAASIFLFLASDEEFKL